MTYTKGALTKKKNDYTSIYLKLYIGNIKLKTYYRDYLIRLML